MGLSNSNKWAASGACAAAAFVIFSPYVYATTNYLLLNRGYVKNAAGPTLFGLLLHTIVVFFIFYGILAANWACA